eukprot:1147181-Pelagomonas_calceolata.AAC.1
MHTRYANTVIVRRSQWPGNEGTIALMTLLPVVSLVTPDGTFSSTEGVVWSDSKVVTYTSGQCFGHYSFFTGAQSGFLRTHLGILERTGP